MTFRIDSNSGQIGRFWWDNSGQGGLFLPHGQFFTSFRPGRCGWRESWPDESAGWPVRPWGKGDSVDEHWRDFTAFEPWFDRMIKDRKLDGFGFTITDKIEMYSLLVDIFNAGIEASQNPWRWAKDVEGKLLRQAAAASCGAAGPGGWAVSTPDSENECWECEGRCGHEVSKDGQCSWVECDHCDGTGKVDDYGNPFSGDRVIYCCFPDCGCGGARLCQAENGASGSACAINIERTRFNTGLRGQLSRRAMP